VILLQILGVLVVAAATYQLWILATVASKRAAREDEQRRLTLALLRERVLAASKARQFEETQQALSWSGYRKFVVANKVFEDVTDDAVDPHDLETRKLNLGARIVASSVESKPNDVAQSHPLLVREDPPEDHPITGDEIVLGRMHDADVVIDNATVSTRHARIFRKEEDWYIQDLGSRNGTLINMKKVGDTPVLLRRNDHIRIASIDFRILLPVKKQEVERSPEICSFYLAPHDGKPLPPFKPGQYLTFQLRIPGIDKPTIRCYSLSDCVQPDHYRVTIKRVPPPPDRPDLRGGLSSSFFHDHVQQGDILDVQAPRGGFHLDTSKDNPVVLIGGGIGVTPVLSMLNAIAASGSKREAWFFYGVRHGAEHVMRQHLNRIAREKENVRLNVCYSAPAAGDVQGRDYDHAERVTVDLLKRLLPSSNYEFYICGPAPMMNQLIADLKAWGVPEAQIHYEAFGPATVKRVSRIAVPVDSGRTFKVTFARSGVQCAWDPAATSLLDFAAAQGVRIDSGCRAGNCGTCLTAVRSGEFSYRIEPGAAAGPGTCLTCISVPKGDLVLDA
jgi:ferredoxin-NADP reductase